MKVSAAALAGSMLLLATGSASADDKPYSRLCLIEVTDGPALERGGYGSLLWPTGVHMLPTAPYFVASSGGALWTVDKLHKRQRISAAPQSLHHVVRDVVGGPLLVAMQGGLFNWRGEGDQGQLVPVAGNARALHRMRALVPAESLGATYALTDEGVYRYRPESGATLIPSTSTLTTRHVAVAAELPQMRRLAFAYDSGLYLLDADGRLEQVPDFPSDAEDRIEHLVGSADGAGVIVIRRLSALAVLRSPDGQLVSRVVVPWERYSRIDGKWSSTVEEFAPLGEAWRSALESYLEARKRRSQVEAEALAATHPTAGLVIGLPKNGGPSRVDGEPGWRDIGGVEQLAGQPVNAVMALPYLEAVLVGAGNKLFLILDRTRPSGAACSQPVSIEQASHFCARELGGPLPVRPDAPDDTPAMTAIVEVGKGPDGFLPLPGAWAKPRREDGFFYRMPWRNKVLGILGRGENDVEIFSPDGRTRTVGGQPVPKNIRSFRYEVLAVAPELEMIVLKTDDKLFVLLGRNDDLTPVDQPGWYAMTALAAFGRDILIAASGEIIGQEWGYGRRGPPREALLYRLDEHGRLLPIPLATSDRPSEPRAASLGLAPWPGGGGILASVDGRLYLWRDGKLTQLPMAGKDPVHFGPNSRFIDRGPGKPALLADNSGIWSVDIERGAADIWRRPAGDWFPVAFDADPFSDGAIAALRQGLLLRIDLSGATTPIPSGGEEKVGRITEVRAAPFAKAVFVRTAYGWRVLEADGVLRRIAGLPNDRVFRVRVFPGMQRVFGDDRRPYEFIRIKTPGTSCAPAAAGQR